MNIAKHGNDTYRIVGFEVEPLSIAEDENRLVRDMIARPIEEMYAGGKISTAVLEPEKDYTYSWEVKTKIVPWGHRMDHFNKIEISPLKKLLQSAHFRSR